MYATYCLFRIYTICSIYTVCMVYIVYIYTISSGSSVYIIYSFPGSYRLPVKINLKQPEQAGLAGLAGLDAPPTCP